MKAAILLSTVSLVLAAVPAAQVIRRQPEPFVRVGVSYRSELSRDRERAAADLEAIQTLGFNSLRVPVEWAEASRPGGQYRFDDVGPVAGARRPSGAEGRAALWTRRRRRTGCCAAIRTAGSCPRQSPTGARPDRACLDHPGVRADVEAYVGAVASRAAGHPAWQASTSAVTCRTASACARTPSVAFASG